MKKRNIKSIKWSEWKSPSGKFHGFGKDLSAAVGDVPGGWPKAGHPFNLELGRLPPGKAVCPLHLHTTQYELYVIVSGTGVTRTQKRRHKIKAGDVFMHEPGEAHQLVNTGKRDLVYYLVADNPPVDIFYYPDSDKWGMRPHRGSFRKQPVDYHDGEE
ncbi:MAG TPA: cupin domain-containing protein [Opitutaceae bacterium]|nr:cupin domain-containing protein [Opitutaceae bacterium]